MLRFGAGLAWWNRRSLSGVASDLSATGPRARLVRAIAFALSDVFGARVKSRDHTWQADLRPLRGGSLAADLGLRDFTVDVIAQPLAGGELVDPLEGRRDRAAGRLRLAGASALDANPLRALRLVRLAVELDLEPDDEARRAARAAAGALAGVAAERVFGELKRIGATRRGYRGRRPRGNGPDRGGGCVPAWSFGLNCLTNRK